MQWWIQGVSEVSGNQPNLEQQPLVNRGLSICGNAFPASLHKPAAFISVININVCTLKVFIKGGHT